MPAGRNTSSAFALLSPVSEYFYFSHKTIVTSLFFSSCWPAAICLVCRSFFLPVWLALLLVLIKVEASYFLYLSRKTGDNVFPVLVS